MTKKVDNGIITKREAQELLSAQLRNPHLDSELFVKVLSLYSKIAGWDKEPDSAPETNLDELVVQVERKRKTNA